MRSGTPKLVVILAAGTGSRLGPEAPPKPLLDINGRALVLRVLDRFLEAGIEEAVIVLGHRAKEVKRGIEAGAPGMRLCFVVNPRYLMGLGLSALAAREAVGDREFFLSMADHVFEPSLIKTLAEATIPRDGLVLAVDRKLDEIYDEEDATKVRTQDGRIVAIHKQLAEFDAVDTGLFSCTPAIFDALAAAAEANGGDATLSDGVTALVAAGRAVVHDIGAGKWQDVDTPGAARRAADVFR